MKRFLPLVLVALSCTDSSAPVVVENPLGNRFRVLGEADQTDALGRRAICHLDLIMELTGESRPAAAAAAAAEFPGIMGGGVDRTVLEADGSGFGFFADVYWPDAVARVGTRDRVDLILSDTLLVEGRFWREIALLRGARDGDGASGTWTCAPFDIWENGYVDTVLVVQGTWWTERIALTP